MVPICRRFDVGLKRPDIFAGIELRAIIRNFMTLVS